MAHFYNLRITKIIEYILKQKTSYWFILLYLIVEYLRPQSMYPVLQIIPWGNLVLVGALLFALVEQKLFKVRNTSNLFINLFALVILASSLLALSPATSFGQIKSFFVLLIIYYLITNIVNTEEKLFIFIILFLLISLKLSQAVFFNWILRGFEYDQYGAAVGSGWLENSGELAIQLCIAFSLSICLLSSLWSHNRIAIKTALAFVPIVFAGGVIACGSRGSYLALGSVVLTILLTSKRKTLGILLLLLIAISTPYIISERDMNRTVNMGGEQDTTAQNRLERWHKGIKMTNSHPILGVGFENWAVADVELFYGTGAECHNIFIECMSELGYVGLFVFFLLIFSTYKNNAETIKLSKQTNSPFLFNLAISLNLSLLAYLVAGFFVTVLYYPYFWINLAMTVSLNNIARKKYMTKD